MDWGELGGVAFYLLGVALIAAAIMGVLNYLFASITKRLGRAVEITRPPWKAAIAWFVNFLIIFPLIVLLVRLAEMILPEDKATYLAFTVFFFLVVAWGWIESRLIKRWPQLKDWIKP